MYRILLLYFFTAWYTRGCMMPRYWTDRSSGRRLNYFILLIIKRAGVRGVEFVIQRYYFQARVSLCTENED